MQESGNSLRRDNTDGMRNALISVKDVAERLRCSVFTVYRFTRSGSLQSYKIGSRDKVSERDLEDFLAQRRRRAPTSLINLLTNPPDRPIDRSKGGTILARVRAFTLAKNGEFLGGTVYRRKTGKGNRWCLNYQANGRRIRRVIRLAQTEQEALLALQEEIRREFDREYSVKREKEKVRFREFKETYLTNYAKLKKRSWQSDEKYLNSQLVPFFGEMELSEISPLDIHQFMAKRQKDGVKNSTINRELTVLKKMLSLAIKWGYAIAANPVEKGNYFSEDGYQRDRVLSYEEEQKLFLEAAPHLRPILTCALSTGMRYSEILGLSWDCVDLEKRQIVVKAESSKRGKKRIIPINETLLIEFMKLRKSNKAKSGFVFLYEDPQTEKLRPVKTVRRAFVMACQRAKIKNLHFHDLRHTAGTRLIEKGADPISVRDILGHSKLKTTEVYLHSNLSRMEAAVRLLDKPQEKDVTVLSPECHQFSSHNGNWSLILFNSMN